MAGAVALPPPSPRDAEVQAVVLRLVEAYAFVEAAAVLNARLREIRETRRTHLETLPELRASAPPALDRGRAVSAAAIGPWAAAWGGVLGYAVTRFAAGGGIDAAALGACAGALAYLALARRLLP